MLRTIIFLIILISGSTAYGAHCNIPKAMRVPNRTGCQCVWSSLETLGRYNRIKGLYNLSNDKRCQGPAAPRDVRSILKERNIKYELKIDGGDEFFIKYVKKHKWGVTFGTDHKHTMTMVHFDEVAGIVKFIDNADRRLRIQTWSMSKFKKHFDGWTMVVIPESPKSFVLIPKAKHTKILQTRSRND